MLPFKSLRWRSLSPRQDFRNSSVLYIALVFYVVKQKISQQKISPPCERRAFDQIASLDVPNR